MKKLIKCHLKKQCEWVPSQHETHICQTCGKVEKCKSYFTFEVIDGKGYDICKKCGYKGDIFRFDRWH